MAVTVTAVSPQGTYNQAFNIIADSDADTTATITHTLGATPFTVTITPLTAAARVSAWVEAGRSSTQVVLGKTTSAGSGAAPIQVRVNLALPHSISA